MVGAVKCTSISSLVPLGELPQFAVQLLALGVLIGGGARRDDERKAEQPRRTPRRTGHDAVEARVGGLSPASHSH